MKNYVFDVFLPEGEIATVTISGASRFCAELTLEEMFPEADWAESISMY